MQFWQFLQQNNAFFLILFGLIGLVIGGFLNVIIYRTPLIMMQRWRIDSIQFLKSQPDIPSSLITPIDNIISNNENLALFKPLSHCTKCKYQIKWYENIPLISWIILKGRCSCCHHNISRRYPFVELVTALLSSLVIYQMGVQVLTPFTLIFVWCLITLAGIDFETQYLPDKLTFPLAGLGLVLNSQGLFVSPTHSILGLIIGYLSLWLVAQLFYLIFKKKGMAEGDFKLLAALGAWLGVMMLPFIILLSSLLGSVIGIILMIKNKESKPFAFGPYLAISGIFGLLYGSDIIQWYLGSY